MALVCDKMMFAAILSFNYLRLCDLIFRELTMTIEIWEMLAVHG